MRVFIIAFACEPGRTSEPGVGWNVVGELAKRHQLTVLTRCNNREQIELFCSSHPEDSHALINWEYLDLPEWFHRLKKKIPCGIQLYQEVWQLKAARKYKAAFLAYDIVHHLTFGSIFFTPWAARYSNSFVWGPIGGAAGAMEDAFLKNERLVSRVSEVFYRLVAWYSFHPFPWAKACRKACRVVLYRTSELAARAPRNVGQIVGVKGEAAYPGDVVPRVFNNIQHPLRVVSVGRLIPLKGVRYTIEAFAKFIKRGGAGSLEIYGDGPLKSELQALARRLGVNGKVTFHGNVPNIEVLRAMSAADVLVHASFREGISWTILEAMAHGVPVICQDRAGMKDVVTADCGVRISAATPGVLIEGIANGLYDYYKHPETIRMCGEAGQLRVRTEYRWSQIAEVIDRKYREVCNG